MDEKNQNATGGEPEAWAGEETKRARQRKIWILGFRFLGMAMGGLVTVSNYTSGEVVRSVVFGLLTAIFAHKFFKTLKELRKEAQP
ncbi:hypothetical protein [Leisingera sp. JC11]|uniref:hypothetical protein n=1 Tax=Leisingera sp. JC11 TaxID=3042469 RepID=UPI003456E9BC